MRLKRYSIAIIIVAVISLVSFWGIFTVPEKPQLLTIDSHKIQTDWYCHKSDAPSFNPTTLNPTHPNNNVDTGRYLDTNGQLNILVWNLHKQEDDGWQKALSDYSKSSELILLQEASLTDSFKEWLTTQSWGASYVNAFEAFGVSSGVVNLASQLPNEACAYTAVEPWILLPKSGLYARYNLSNGEELAVINAHAINFTIGTDEYLEQIKHLQAVVKKHKGPLIVAGDLNTWSDIRTNEIRKMAKQLGLKEVVFTPDNRRLFINDLPLDHVYYRGLDFKGAQSNETNASDHNPMQVQFTLYPNDKKG